jgi:hypothetical protein
MNKTEKLLRYENKEGKTQVTPFIYIEGVLQHEFGENAYNLMKSDIKETWRRFALNSMVSQGQEMITSTSTYEEIRKELVKVWGEENVKFVESDLQKYIEKRIREQCYVETMMRSARQCVSCLVQTHGASKVGWSNVRRSLLEMIGKRGYEKIKFRVRADLPSMLKEFEGLRNTTAKTLKATGKEEEKDEEEEMQQIGPKEIYQCIIQNPHEDDKGRCGLFLSELKDEENSQINVVVLQVDDACRLAGIELLDILLEVDGKKVESGKHATSLISKSLSNVSACVLKLQSSHRIREKDWICAACTFKMDLSNFFISTKNAKLNIDRITRCMHPGCDHNFVSFFGLSKSPKHCCDRCGTVVCVEHTKKNMRDGTTFRCQSCYEERKMVTTCSVCKTRR